jgi:hypothetical protein
MEVYRKYPIGYKPRVCIANFTFICYPKSIHKDLKSKNKWRVEQAMKKVKTVECELYPIVLDDENNFPTKKLKQSLKKLVWREKELKGDADDYKMVLRNLEVKSESRICYKFDEHKH